MNVLLITKNFHFSFEAKRAVSLHTNVNCSMLILDQMRINSLQIHEEMNSNTIPLFQNYLFTNLFSLV